MGRKRLEGRPHKWLHMWRAHAAVSKAISEGKLVRPTACTQCGSSERIEGHHENYSKPLDVMWLCRVCHRELHMAKNRAKKARRAALLAERRQRRVA